jgi:hypothetical protein
MKQSPLYLLAACLSLAGCQTSPRLIPNGTYKSADGAETIRVEGDTMNLHVDGRPRYRWIQRSYHYSLTQEDEVHFLPITSNESISVMGYHWNGLAIEREELHGRTSATFERLTK